MQLPKYKKSDRKKLKICQEAGCGKEFWGHPIAKYCEIHRDIRNRKRRARKTYEDPSVSSKVFRHKFNEVTNVEFTCALEGCERKFTVKVFPKQDIYQKFCSEHINEFKRIHFNRSRGVKP